MFSHSNSQSLSKVTQHPTAVTVPSVGGTAISTIYNNKHSSRASESSSRVVKHSVYRDVPNMKRVNKHQKGKELKVSGAYRTNVIAEMMSRIESLIIAKEMNLLEMDDPFATLKTINTNMETNDFPDSICLHHRRTQPWRLMWMETSRMRLKPWLTMAEYFLLKLGIITV